MRPSILSVIVLVRGAIGHPLCGLDRGTFESPLARDLSFCSQYAESTCCTLEEDFALEDEFGAWMDIHGLSLSSTCKTLYMQFLCGRCDPFQAHLYDLESSSDPRQHPYLCEAFANNITNECEEAGIDFVSLIGPAPYCLPVDLPQAGNGGLDIYYEFDDAQLIDYADDGNGHEYYASFDGKLFEVDQGSNAKPAVVFEFRDIFNQGELGFLTFELDSNFKTNYFVWTYHSIQESVDAGNRRYTVLSRVTLPLDQPGQAADVCEIMRVVQRGWNHNGGDIELLDDGTLLLSLGDDAPQNGNGRGQDKGNIYGSVIRIRPNRDTCVDSEYRNPEDEGNMKRTISDNYEIPEGNPFIDDPDARSEIFWYGFRNPWRTFQHNGDVYIGEVGQQLWEEVDIARLDDNGTNYGWDILEGNNCFKDAEACQAVVSSSSYRSAIYDYPHFPGDLRPGQQHLGFSLSLGHVYSGDIRTELSGKVLMGDYVNQQIWAILPVGNPWSGAELVVNAAGSVVTMRKNSQNETVILTLGSIAYKLKSQDDPASTPNNGVCELGENCKDDSYDCLGDLKGSPKWCCADGICSVDFEECPDEIVCNATTANPGCGNNFCDAGENCTSCKWDCPGHQDANEDSNDFCCVGTEFGVSCQGDGCNDASCSKGNKQGDRNFKNQHEKM